MWKQTEQTYWQAAPFRAVAEPGIQLKVWGACVYWPHHLLSRSVIPLSHLLWLSTSRWLSLRQVQVSIWETPSGTQEIPPGRSVSFGRTPGMSAGRTRFPTAGSSSTDHRLDTSGTNTQLSLRHVHSNCATWLTTFPSCMLQGSLFWGFRTGGGHRGDNWHQYERRATGSVLLLSGKYNLVQFEVSLQRWVSASWRNSSQLHTLKVCLWVSYCFSSL